MLILILSLLAYGNDVVIHGERLNALQDDPTPPHPEVAERIPLTRTVTFSERDETTIVSVEWSLTRGDRPVTLSLAGDTLAASSATLDGRPLALLAVADGLVAEVPAGPPAVISIRGALIANTLTLMPAASGSAIYQGSRELEVVADGASAVRVGRTLHTGAERLTLNLATPRLETAGAVVQAQVATGVTVHDAEVRFQSLIRFHVRRGSAREFTFDAPDLGTDVAFSAPAGAEIVRDGAAVRVSLPADSRSSVEVAFQWTRALGAGDVSSVPVPRITPRDVLSAEYSLQVARDAELEVIPEIRGARSGSVRSAPTWARGLVEGTPTAVWSAGAPPTGAFTALRFTPVEQPAVLVDIAEHELAFSQEGRAVGHTRLTVRNERAGALAIALPPGMRLIALTVDGTVRAAAPAGDGWRVAIPRSLETAQGPLAFPVDFWWISEGSSFNRRDARDVPLPTVDAPLATLRTVVRLPRDAAREKVQDRANVEAFTEASGIAYGFGSVNEAAAETLFRDAVDAYKRNDFSAASGSLATLRGLGASNANIDRLESNLDSFAKGGDSVIDRRLRAQAQARAFDGQIAQAEALEEAKDAERRGDLAAASSSYQQALTISSTLAVVEQKEEADQEDLAQELEERLAEVSRRSVANKAIEAPEEPALVADAEPARPVDFSGIEMDGDLITPDGWIGDRVGSEPSAGWTAAFEPTPQPADEEATDDLAEGAAGAAYGEEIRGVAGAVQVTEVVRTVQSLPAVSRRTLSGVSTRTTPARPAPMVEAQAEAEAEAHIIAGPRAARPKPTVRPDASTPMSPPPPPPPPMLAGLKDDSDTPQVIATRPGVVIPALGPELRYEHTLVAAGEAPVIHLYTRTRKP